MGDTTISSLLTVSTQYAPAWLMVAQADYARVSCLDRFMLNYCPYLVYRTHIAVAPGQRAVKPDVVRQYGEGLITKGIIILNIDRQGREAHDITNTDTTGEWDLLFKQALTGGTEGTQFDITMYLAGYGIQLRRTELGFSEQQNG